MSHPIPWSIAQVPARVASPWAVLICRFKDGPQELPIPLDTFERLFTAEGEGTWNVVRFFRDMSHGALDLGGSKVFGMFTLDLALAEYGPEMSDADRSFKQADVVRMARKAALLAGVPLDDFVGDCISFNVAVGGAQGSQLDGRPFAWADHRWVANNGTQCWGHEMGHAYGLGHSRRDGSYDDYQDPWDTMSTAAAFSAPDPDFGLRGPGLNAANMRRLAWLKEDRVWKGTPGGFDQTIELRPLHRHELPGLLAAELPPYLKASPGYLVEYRPREGWDAGITRSAVLVHQLFGDRSYLVANHAGVRDLVKGDVLERGAAGIAWSPYARIEVIEIDDASRTAKLRLQYRPAAVFPRYDIPSKLIGPVAADGGGVVIHGGSVTPIGPWDPVVGLLDDLTLWNAAQRITDPHVRRIAKREALREMGRRVERAAATLEAACAPIPAHVPGGGQAGTAS